MGGFLHPIDIEQGSMARKVVADKRHGGGLDAPRNSLETPIKAYQNYYAIEDNIPNMFQLTNDWSKKNYYQTEAPMKKLISEEISKKPNSTRHKSPSVIARLMGVDTLPLDAKSGVQHAEKRNEKLVTDFRKEKQTQIGSIYDVPFSKLIKFDPFHHNEDKDPEWSNNTNYVKPRSREHPQEEELQKFKKEFEAFQAARLKECSKVVEWGTAPSQWIAQDNLNKEKMVLYANSARKSTNEKPKEHDGNYVKVSPPKGENEKLCISSAPTKIVILRPGPDNIGMEKNEESRASSSGTSEERGNMEEFLEEVKERLKCEIQGKSFKRGNIVRGGGIETPYSERPSSDPKQIAQRIAKQVRESVTMDFGLNLVRSESTRSYRNEVVMNNGTGSPEYVSKDTRRFLSDRLRNVLKRETHQNILMGNQEQSRFSGSDRGRSRLNKVSYWDSGNDEHDTQSRSFRCGPDDDEMSPSNLVRSLSAPVSGTAFGKLLLEDRQMSTGAHIRRKQETIERVGMKVKKQKKDRFNNLRERVSSFKYSFTLRGRLFRRKIQSAEESLSKERDFLRNIMSGPTVMMNLGCRYENSTEVPPSPASVCSSIHEEYWRPVDNLSPTSSSNIPSSPLFFKDISSNLNELRRQLNQLETDESEDTINQDQPSETEMPELEDQIESYIRDLLVASGIYDGSLDKSLSRWDQFTKPISNCILEEVKESYTKNTEDTKDQNEYKVVDQKMLLDLLNEVLSAVLGPPLPVSKFKKKAVGPSWQPPRGRKLLEHVWDVMRIYVYPSADKLNYSLDSMVGQDLALLPWSGLMNADTDVLGKEIECWIISDLIEEMVKDIRSQ